MYHKTKSKNGKENQSQEKEGVNIRHCQPRSATATSKERMKLAAIIGIIVGYLTNSLVLGWIFDTTDYDQFVRYYAVRNIVYEVMFSCAFIFAFKASTRLTRAVACFGMILAVSSLIDKALFQVTGYMVSDPFIIAVAFFVALNLYRNGY